MKVFELKKFLKENTLSAVLLFSLVGYIVVIGTFLDIWPNGIYPTLTVWWINRLADAIAIINLSAVCMIIIGWYWIKIGEVKKHKTAMLISFGLIILFLILYLTKIGGGGTKEFVGPVFARYAYLIMLSVHIGLSIFSVPLIIYQVITGITRSPSEIIELKYHRKIGRVGATAWIISLSLGVITYALLNHIYTWKFIGS
jgi:putative membrane protein